jgi:hypothetical protein
VLLCLLVVGYNMACVSSSQQHYQTHELQDSKTSPALSERHYFTCDAFLFHCTNIEVDHLQPAAVLNTLYSTPCQPEGGLNQHSQAFSTDHKQLPFFSCASHGPAWLLDQLHPA